MDKNEYRVKLDEINELVDRQDYKGALRIVETIDWRRVRSARTLCMVGEIYEANKMYKESRRLLLLARQRSPIGKTVLYRLVELSVKMGDFDEAAEYYKQFVEISPNDNSRYILKYKIYRARRSSIEEQISILQEYKAKEYTERWAYELARLYAKAGMSEACVEECDDLILWFSEGKYVLKAMDLKMKYAPLSASQQEKYDRRFTVAPPAPAVQEVEAPVEPEKISDSQDKEIEEILNSIIIGDTAQVQEEKKEEEAQIPDSVPEELPIFQPNLEAPEDLQDKVAQGIRDVFQGKTFGLEETEAAAAQEPSDLASPEEKGYVVKDLEPENIQKTAGFKPFQFRTAANMTMEVKAEAPKSKMFQEGDFDSGAFKTDMKEKEFDLEQLLAETASELAQAVAEETAAEAEKTEEAQITETKPQEEADESSTDKAEEADVPVAEEAVKEKAEELSEKIPEKEIQVQDDTSESASESVEEAVSEVAEDSLEETIATVAEIPAEKNVEAVTESPKAENGEVITASVAEESFESVAEEPREDISEAGTENLKEEIAETATASVAGESFESVAEEPKENISKACKENLKEEVAETATASVAEETFESVSEESKEDISEAGTENLKEEIAETATASVEEESFESVEEEPKENISEAGTENLKEEITGTVTASMAEETLEAVEEEPKEDAFKAAAESRKEETIETAAEIPTEETTEIVKESPKADIDELITESSAKDSVSEDTSEAAAEGDVQSVLEGATREFPVEEVKQALQEVDISEMPEPELKDAAAQEKEEPHIKRFTGSVATEHNRKSAAFHKAVESLMRHRLTEEEHRRLFTYFVPIPGMKQQIDEALDIAQESACEKTSQSGNFIVTGRKGSGKTRLSEGLIKALCKERHMEGAKVAYIPAELLNKKDPVAVIGKLSGGFLVVENAGALNAEVVEDMSKAMEFKTNRLTVILEDLKAGIQSLEKKYPEFIQKFDSRISIPVFTNDELVSFAKTYAKELGYKIDDMAVLAIYTLIGDNQNEENPVAIKMVREMMDDAIKTASRRGRKVGKRVSKRHLDESGRIMLYEKDFDV